jgi:putative ubiquitin-RnfH superfamily antitoxin RatB of RatAB toxin-antitoxin module
MIGVEVAYATPARQVVIAVQLPAGSTLEEAIDRSGIRAEFPDMVIDPAALGIFGRTAPPGQVLREGDRVEIYRPLIADPKEARRRRAEQKKPV